MGREQNIFEICNYHKRKLARVWIMTPPSGEPGEPRWHIAKQRRPSPKPEVEVKQNRTDKNQRRNRSHKRGIRSEVATNRRKTKHLMKQSAERREYRQQKSETSRGDWRRLATQARQLAKQPPNKAFKDEKHYEQQNSPENKIHTRANIIRGMDKTQHITNR